VSTSSRMKLRWSVLPHELGPVTAALNTLMVGARAQPRCLRCQLSTKMGEHAELEYIEEWTAESDLRRQLQSERFARIAELMERATAPPHFEFSVPGGTRGIEYALEARAPGDG
jgi:quinol monooxygenase YgiN